MMDWPILVFLVDHDGLADTVVGDQWQVRWRGPVEGSGGGSWSSSKERRANQSSDD